MTTERFYLNKKKTNRNVFEFLSGCVKTALSTTTSPFVYGGINFRHHNFSSSEKYFASRVIQMFHNSNPELFSSKDLLIVEGNNVHVLVKYFDDWCFCQVPDNLQQLVKNFGKKQNIYCGFAVSGHAANNIEHFADHS